MFSFFPVIDRLYKFFVIPVWVLMVIIGFILEPLVIAFAILFLFISTFILMYFSKLKVIKIQKLIDDNLNYKEYISYYEKIFERKLSSENKVSVCMYLCSAYLNIGDFGKFSDTMKSIGNSVSTVKNISNKVFYNYLWFLYYSKLSVSEEAQIYYKNLLEMKQTLNPKQLEQLSKVYKYTELVNNLNTMQLNNMETKIKKLIQSSQNRRDEIFANGLLEKYYILKDI